MPGSRKKCAVLGCNRKRTTEPIPKTFHQFPNDPKRCLKWVELCGNFELLGKTVNELYKGHHICTYHFLDTDKYKTNNGTRLLDTTRLPSLELPRPIAVTDKIEYFNLPCVQEPQQIIYVVAKLPHQTPANTEEQSHPPDSCQTSTVPETTQKENKTRRKSKQVSLLKNKCTSEKVKPTPSLEGDKIQNSNSSTPLKVQPTPSTQNMFNNSPTSKTKHSLFINSAASCVLQTNIMPQQPRGGPRVCSVYGCGNKFVKFKSVEHQDEEHKKKFLSFFAFPTQKPILADLWREAVKNNNPSWQIPEKPFVCSDHFHDSDLRGFYQYRRIREDIDVVPSIFPQIVPPEEPRIHKKTKLNENLVDLTYCSALNYSENGEDSFHLRCDNETTTTFKPDSYVDISQFSDDNSAMIIEVCDPPEATQVFSDDDDEDGLRTSTEFDGSYYENEMLNSEEVSTCRTCGQFNKDLVGIFSPEGVRLHLQYKINTNLPIKVGVNDSLPTSICHKCLERLEACQLIRESSRRTDIELRAAMALKIVMENHCYEIKEPSSQIPQKIKQNTQKLSNQTETQPCEFGLPKILDVISLSTSSACDETFASSPLSECNYSTPANSPVPLVVDDEAMDTNSNPQVEDMICTSEEKISVCLNIGDPGTQGTIQKTNQIISNISNPLVTQNQMLGEDSVSSGIEFEIQQKKNRKRKSVSKKNKISEDASFLSFYIKTQDTSAMSCTELADFMDKLEKDIELSKERMLEEEQVFTCSECSSSFTEEYQYNVHVHHHKIKDKWSLFTCRKCKLKFKSAYLLLQHNRSAHHHPKIFKCEPCNKTFNRNDIYQFHLNSKHSTQRFNCHLCSYTFVSKYQMKSHIKHHDKKKCVKCGEPFTSIASFELHQSRPCSAYKQSGEKRLHSKKSGVTTDGETSCPECNIQFKGDSFLRRHLLHKHPNSSHNSNLNCIVKSKSAHHLISTLHCNKNATRMQISRSKKHVCEVCNKSFAEQAYLKNHMNVHTKSILYNCTICDKTSYQKYAMRSHILSHSDERPFSCTYCDNKFKRRDALYFHIRTHTGEKPHVCQYCGRGFAQPGDMKKHENTHLGVNTSRKRKKPTPTSVS